MKFSKIFPGLGIMALACGLSSCLDMANSGSGAGNNNDIFSRYRLPTMENPTSNISRFTGYSENVTDTTRTITLSGTTESGVGDSGVAEVINSMGKTVTSFSVIYGSYEQTVEIAEGRNVVRVTIFSEGKIVEQGEIEVGNNREIVPVRVRLEWDKDSADVDLWIQTPKGNQIWYGEKTAPDGFLDIDDVDGYGPETISLLSADTGTYTIYVNLYDTHGQNNSITATVRISFDEKEWESIATETFTAADADNSNQSKRAVHSFSIPGAIPLLIDTEEEIVEEVIAE